MDIIDFISKVYDDIAAIYKEVIKEQKSKTEVAKIVDTEIADKAEEVAKEAKEEGKEEVKEIATEIANDTESEAKEEKDKQVKEADKLDELIKKIRGDM